MRKTFILTAMVAMGLTSAAVAQENVPTGSQKNLGGAPAGMSSPENTGMESGRSSDQSGTHDTGVGTDQKLNVGPGAKSPLPPPASADH